MDLYEIIKSYTPNDGDKHHQLVSIRGNRQKTEIFVVLRRRKCFLQNRGTFIKCTENFGRCYIYEKR